MNYSTLSEAYNTDSFDKKKKKSNNKASKHINHTNIEEYSKNNASCEPLQPPEYKFPLSVDSINNYNKSMDVYIKNNVDNDNDNDINNSKNNINSNISPQLQKVYENYDNISTEKIKDIEPYYDDDLDQYLNINELKSAINYNSSYNCKNTSSDPENHKNVQLKTQNNCIYYPHPEQYASYSTQNNQYYK